MLLTLLETVIRLHLWASIIGLTLLSAVLRKHLNCTYFSPGRAANEAAALTLDAIVLGVVR